MLQQRCDGAAGLRVGPLRRNVSTPPLLRIPSASLISPDFQTVAAKERNEDGVFRCCRLLEASSIFHERYRNLQAVPSFNEDKNNAVI